MLGQFVVDFFNNPQTRDINEPGGLKDILSLAGNMMHSDTKGTFSVKSTTSCGFTPGCCQMLSASKFGCVFKEKRKH